MRANFSSALESRLRRPDSPIQEIIEGLAVTRSSIKDTKAEFEAADSLTGLEVDPEGGLRLTSTVGTIIDQTTHDSSLTNLSEANPVLFARLELGGSESNSLEIHRVTARLDPDADGVSGKNVDQWLCRLWSLVAAGTGTLETDQELEIAQLADVRVTAGAGVGDVVFDFSALSPRPKPKQVVPRGTEAGQDPPPPTLLIQILALQANGAPATNAGWRADSTKTTQGTGNVLTPLQLARRPDGRWELDVALSSLMRVKVESGSYSAATVTFSGAANKLDLGAVPSSAANVEFVVHGARPAGTSLTAQAREDGGPAWVDILDGQTAADVALPAAQKYDVRATLTPDAAGLSSPLLVRLGGQERTVTRLDHVARVKSVRWAVDPFDGGSEISECVIGAIHDGNRDYRDAITELLSTTHLGDLAFRLYLGEPLRGGLRGEGIDPVLAEDGFIDPNATDLVDHTPDTGLGTWTYDGASTVLTIQGNAVEGSETSFRFARGSDDVGDDELEIKCKVDIDTAAGTGQNGGLWALGKGTIGEGLAFMARRFSGTAVNLEFERRDDLGAIQQSVTVLANFSYAGGAGSGKIWIGLLVSGTTVTPFREDENEAGRVTFTAITIPDLRDGTHKKAGIVTKRGSFNRVIKPDHLRITSLLSEGPVTGLSRDQWLPIDTFLTDDTKDLGPKSEIHCISTLSLLRGVLPIQTGTSPNIKRVPYVVENSTTKAAADDLLDLRAKVPDRYRGAGIEDTTIPVAKTVDDSDIKSELDALAFIAGGGWTTSGGRIRFANLDATEKAIAAIFPREEIRTGAVSAGFSRRVPEFFIRYQYNRASREYDAEWKAINQTAFDTLGLGRVGPPRWLDETISQWIITDAIAETVALRQVRTFGFGEIIVSFETNYPHPELEIGDVVNVQTDQFIARDPLNNRALRGLVWVRGVIVAQHDLWGRGFTILSSFSDIISSGEKVPREEFVTPEITSGTPVLLANGTASMTIRAKEALSVRIASSTSGAPTDAAIAAATLIELDANGSAFVFLGAVAVGQVRYIGAIAYEKADGTGAESVRWDGAISNPQTVQTTSAQIDGWSATQNAAAPENGGRILTADNDEGFSNLEDANATEATYRARLSVLTNSLLPNENERVATVFFYFNDGPASVTWVEVGQYTIDADLGTPVDQEIVFSAALGADFDLRAQLVYQGAGTGTVQVELHGEDNVLPGVAWDRVDSQSGPLPSVGAAGTYVRSDASAWVAASIIASDVGGTTDGARTFASSGKYTFSGALDVGGAATVTGLTTLSGGATVASGQTLTLTGATVAGAPTWSSNQAITLSTAAQPNVTSLGTLTSLMVSGLISANGGLTVASGQTLTVSGATITGLTAASVGGATDGARTFASSGKYTFTGALDVGGAATVTGLATFNGGVSRGQDTSELGLAAAYAADPETGVGVVTPILAARSRTGQNIYQLGVTNSILWFSEGGTADALRLLTIGVGVTTLTVAQGVSMRTLTATTITGSDLLQITRTTEQARLRYNATNYLSLTVAAYGETVYNAVGGTVVTAGASAAAHVFDGTLIEAASGNHALLAGLRINAPTITGGVATVTDAATVYIAGAPTATVSGDVYALLVGAGTLGTAATTTSRAGLRIPHGTAPTSPVDGDVWTTTTALFARINGVTKEVAFV